MKEALEVLDNVRLNFFQSCLLALNITIAFIMFGVDLDIKIQHFKDLVMKPKPAIVGVFSQFILLPAITLGFILLLNTTPTVALGMILITAWWGVWHIISGLTISTLWSKKSLAQPVAS